MPELFEHFEGYDVQLTRQQAKNEGLLEGDLTRLISLICTKLAKGRSISEIAADLEESPEKISNICKIANSYAPDYNVNNICKEILKNIEI